jgi:hypothetical protein
MPSFFTLDNRRGGKSLIRLLALLLALAVAAPVLLADEQDYGQDRDHHDQGPRRDTDSIVGSWVVQVFPNPPAPPPMPNMPHNKNLFTCTADGGSLNSDPTFGTGHGVWKKVAPRTFAVKFLTLIPPGFDPPYPPEALATTSSEPLTLNLHGDEIRGPFKVVLTHPVTGQELLSFDGTVVLTRIKF